MPKTTRKKSKTAQTQPARKRTTRLDMIATESMQNHSHMATSDIVRRRDVLTAEVEATDAELIELMARTAEARSRRAKTEAALAGIMQVLLNRC